MGLQGFGRGPSVAGYPTTEWSPQTKLIQAPEGGMLFLPCNNTNNLVSHNRIPPEFKYNGDEFGVTENDAGKVGVLLNRNHSYCSGVNIIGNGEKVLSHRISAENYDEASSAFTIALHNFTHAHSGLYECLHYNGSQKVVTQRYGVSATLFRHTVFQPPMQNVTVRLGDPAEMVCEVRFNFLPGSLVNRILWRSEHHLLAAESIPEVADKARWRHGFGGSFHFSVDKVGRCSSTMKIDTVSRKDAGRYECWLRVDDPLDGWFMQEAYLIVV
ncbi:uncharacterized protein LOC129581212 [Paramacrobiotus metropolitanus]|uniref:uncharacterized protein LOC129581212 n=1 Tax=Paramacrobiotus metropolitanus TaxID=2943436 RepID=UPI002445CF1C|nr:uncharacterized protein LOC129581212 [Paramacrobiotus metropolitanus]